MTTFIAIVAANILLAIFCVWLLLVSDTPLHLKLEQRIGWIWGTYTVAKEFRRGPFGLVWIGPIGPLQIFETLEIEGYLAAWRGASGLEVTVLGRSFFVGRA